MNQKRRNLIKALPIGALLPGMVVHGLANSAVAADLSQLTEAPDIDDLYNKSLVIDGLVIPRG